MIQQQPVSYYAAPGLIAGYKIPGKRYSPDRITEQICDYLCVSLRDVHSKCRDRPMVECRQICMYFLRKLTTLSLKGISGIFNRDHTTALHAIRTVENLMATDSKYKAKIEHLSKIL